MAQLGYGGIANTFGIRSFSGKVAADVVTGRSQMHMRHGYLMLQSRGFRSIILFLLGAQ